MKKKIIFILMIIALCVTACGKKATPETQAETQEEQEESTEEEPQNKTEEEAIEPETNTQEPEDGVQPISITVFFSNADATAFTTEDVQVSSLSPEEVMMSLITKGIVTAGVEIIEFKMTTVEDKTSIQLDLNEAFSSYLSSMGTTGEYYTIGGLCNTFLKAYNCDQIKITVNGEDLTSGHAEYPGYLTVFE